MNKNENSSIESYSKSDYQKFKHYDRFKFLMSEMNSALKQSKSLLDIGCAKGELIYLLKEKFPEIEYTGLEYSKKLIDMALNEEFLNGVKFIQGDAQDFDLEKQYDIVVMSGVLSIFDDIDNVLNNMLDHINKGGRGYIFGAFNEEDIDVIVRFRNNFIGSDVWESGWNMFSIQTIEKAIKKRIQSFEYKKFKLSINLPKQHNPVTTHTVDIINGDKIILTGAGIIRNFYLLSFTKG